MKIKTTNQRRRELLMIVRQRQERENAHRQLMMQKTQYKGPAPKNIGGNRFSINNSNQETIEDISIKELPVRVQLEMDLLNDIIKKEETHLQWSKQGLCVFVLVTQVLVGLARGSSSFESLIGLTRCTYLDWLL
jgi:hypothetical protein